MWDCRVSHGFVWFRMVHYSFLLVVLGFIMVLSWFGDGFVMVLYGVIRLCVGLYGFVWFCKVF